MREKVKAPDVSVLVPDVKLVDAFRTRTDTPTSGSLPEPCTMSLTKLVLSCEFTLNDYSPKERTIKAIRVPPDLNSLNLI